MAVLTEYVCVTLQLELQHHTFFSPINWDDLMARKITPPFIPSVVCSNLLCKITILVGYLIFYIFLIWTKAGDLN